MNRDSRIGMEVPDQGNHVLPENATTFSKSIQDLGQNLFGRDQMTS